MLFHFFKRVRQSAGKPDYVQGPLYDGSGAGRYVLAEHGLMPVTYYGAGNIPQRSLRVLQHPQVYVTPAVPISGLGGLQAGQFILSPLIKGDNQ